nr:unnamed protein product [Callosobruchus chinensis]
MWRAAASTTMSILDAVQRRAIRLIGDPALTCHLQPLSHRRAVAFTLAPMLPLDKCLHNTPTNILNQIYREDPLGTIKTIFDHSYKTNVEAEVEKCLLFLYKEIVKMEDKLSNEINDLLFEEGKKIIRNSGAFEFGLVMPYLVASKLTKTIAGQQELVNLVAEIAEIDGTFDPLEKDGDNVKRVLMCVDSILPLFNRRAIRLIGDQTLTCHLQPLSHRRAVGDLSLFYRCSNGFCSS